jgi:multidrug efflux pump
MALNPSAPFIKRPVATLLLTVAIALAGIVAFQFLPVSPLPQVDFPTLSIAATLPGASPEIMASSVATPLERQFGHIAGITEMTSSSFLGSTSITLQFDLNRDINGAARDVEAAINAARSYLPANLPANPTYRIVNPADAPIMIIALTSTVLDRPALFDAASTIVEQKLSQVNGVGQVSVGGGALPAVRVEVNPTKLNSYGLGLPDVATVISAQNANSPKGQLADNKTTADILSNDQLMKADLYKPLIIGTKNGAVIHLSDIADVTDSTQSIRAAGYLNGKGAVLLIIFRSPGANIIQTVDRIREALPGLKAAIPPAIDLTVVLDRTTTIRASVEDVERSLVISVCLVILVVFAFLRNARATLIPSIVVPVSLIGTFGIMYLLHYSLDNLSLMALTISTGFVVDDAIVVIENISRYLEKGMKPMEAAFKGAQEIGFTVLTISLSLIAVFIPILMMGGIVGRLFREFAVTLSIAILVSLVISLTATPMMCSRLLKTKEKHVEEHGKLFQLSEKFFDGMLAFYEKTLKVVLAHPFYTLCVLFITIGLNVYLLRVIPKGFFPEQDNGTVFGGIQGSQDISFQAMDVLTKKFVEKIKSDPAVENVMAFIGGRGATNGGFVYIGLKPLNERKISSSDVINRLRPALVSEPGATIFLQAGQDVRIGGRASNAQYQYTLQSDKIEDLNNWGDKLLAEMKKLPGITDANTDQQNHGFQATLNYDRETASRLGITPALIDKTLYDSFGESLASTMYTNVNQYYVVLEVAPPFWQNPSNLSEVYIHSPQGPMVPLDAVAKNQTKIAPLSVNHQSQFPSVTISFNLAPGVAVGQASDTIVAQELKMGMPTTIQGMFSGTLQAFQDSLASEPYLILAALLAVYIVLGILYESYIHPITILSTLPSAGVGAVIALLIFHIELSVVALIGIILLIGIVKKNAILMIDFALELERNENKPPKEAIFEACLLRFRPILMTTMAALFGALPLAFGTGVGSELRRPLGISIMGGLIFSQLLTLYTTPVVYLYMDQMRLWWNRNHGKTEQTGKIATAGACIAILFFSGCVNVGPKYDKPTTPPVPSAFKETGDWSQANPKDSLPHGKYWEIYNDPELNALEEQVEVSNQNIAAAFANFLQARALVKEARAQYFPTVSLAPNASIQHGQASAATGSGQTASVGNFTQYSIPLDASWAPDLWGRVANTVKANQAQAQVSAADLENQKLVAHAELAVDFFQLRAQDSLQKLYQDAVNEYKEALRITQIRLQTGIDSDEAVAQAETQLEQAEAQSSQIGIARAQYEHAIALLVGKPASDFSLPVKPLTLTPPVIPMGVPSQILQRRPDIAASERSVAAANAEIGVAMAAYYPNLSLTGSVGIASDALNTLLSAPTLVWSVGGSLAETLFDGGLRSATVDASKAAYQQTVAVYRQTVLAAFQQVEDDLAGLRFLEKEVIQQGNAVNSSARYVKIATSRYKLGLDPYLDVITAQTSFLTSEQSEITLKMQQLTTSMQLIEALGGGWDDSKLPQNKDL